MLGKLHRACKQYFALIAPVVDQRKYMFAGRDPAGDLVVAGGFAEVGVVEMPVDGCLFAGVGGFEDKLFGFAGEAFREV